MREVGTYMGARGGWLSLSRGGVELLELCGLSDVATVDWLFHLKGLPPLFVCNMHGLVGSVIEMCFFRALLDFVFFFQRIFVRWLNIHLYCRLNVYTNKDGVASSGYGLRRNCRDCYLVLNAETNHPYFTSMGLFHKDMTPFTDLLIISSKS